MKNGIDNDPGCKSEGYTAKNDDTKAVAVEQASRTTKNTVEVCQGLDCLGCGGGAVLLEMEELLQEHQQCCDTLNSDIDLVRGACRNFCTVGPNVHFHDTGDHFSQVKSIADCRQVMESVLASATQKKDDGGKSKLLLPLPSGSLSTMTRVMTQRAERERWNFLRNVAQQSSSASRSKNKHQQRRRRRVEPLLAQLDAIAAMEVEIFKSDKGEIGRVWRRKQRYKQFLRLDDDKANHGVSSPSNKNG